MKPQQHTQLSIFIVFFFMILLAGWYFLSAQKQAATTVIERNYDYIMKNDPLGQHQAPVHYYSFVLSWSPAFCDKQRQRYGDNLPNSLQYQCGTTQQFGWIIHGLWPQNQYARRISEHPRFCKGDLPMVEQTVIERYLTEAPSSSLLQGEWEKHGACAFNDAQTFFEKQRELYRSLKLPNFELSRHELFSWLKKNNPQLQGKHLGASRNELFICYNLKWQVIDCPTIN